MCCSERNQEPDGESAAHAATAPLLQPRKGECLGPQCACLEGMALVLHLNKLCFLFCQLEAKVTACKKWPNSVDISVSLLCLLQ